MFRESNRKTKFFIENKTSAELNVYWINYDGEDVFYKKVNAGDVFKQNTFVSHPWKITNSSGEVIKIVYPKSKDTIMSIDSNHDVSYKDLPPKN